MWLILEVNCNAHLLGRREVLEDQQLLGDPRVLVVPWGRPVLEVLVVPLVHPILGDQVVVEEGEEVEVVVEAGVVEELANNMLLDKQEHRKRDILVDKDWDFFCSVGSVL